MNTQKYFVNYVQLNRDWIIACLTRGRELEIHFTKKNGEDRIMRVIPYSKIPVEEIPRIKTVEEKDKDYIRVYEKDVGWRSIILANIFYVYIIQDQKVEDI